MAVRPNMNRAAHQAAQFRYYRQTPQTMMQNRRRQAFFTVIPTAPTKTTSMGYTVAKTFTIHESEAVDGVRQYELLIDDQPVWVGMGNDRVEGLLAVLMKITDQEPDPPNN